MYRHNERIKDCHLKKAVCVGGGPARPSAQPAGRRKKIVGGAQSSLVSTSVSRICFIFLKIIMNLRHDLITRTVSLQYFISVGQTP